MMGHRGCRLAVTYPEIAKMQTKAVIRAAINVQKKHSDWTVKPEIMIPLVCEVKELKYVKNLPASSRENPNVIWVKSLVPKQKKSASVAISSAVRAALGISIIVPTSYSNLTPAAAISASAVSTTTFLTYFTLFLHIQVES